MTFFEMERLCNALMNQNIPDIEKKMNKVNTSLFEGNRYKSLYDVMKDLASVWSEMK